MLFPATHDAARVGLCSVLLALLFALPISASAQDYKFPDVLPEDAAIGPAAGNQEEPYIERGGDMFLAVWVDRRTVVPSDDPEYATEGDLYAARLDAYGTLLDSIPIVISEELRDQDEARACWNGENWLVTWIASPPTGGGPVSLAARVSPAGVVLDPAPIVVDPGPIGSIRYVATGSDGTNWVVFLSETYQSGMNTETELIGVRISAAGTHIGPAISLFHPTCCYFFSLGSDVAYADGTYLLAFECIPSIYVHDAICGMRFTQSLVKIDTYPFQIASSSGVFREPRVTTNGTDFFVGWYHYVSPPWPPVLVYPYCARVLHDGTSLDPLGIDLSGGVGSGDSRFPRVAWDGVNWIAGWQDDQGARVARVTTDGVVLDPGGMSFPALGVSDITSAGAGGVQIVWEDKRSGGDQPYDIYTAYVSGDMVAGAEAPISHGAPAQVFVDVAVGEAEAMVAYRSDVSGEHRIMAQSTDVSGGPLRGDPVLLAGGSLLTDPEIAWNGSLYLTVWSEPDGGAIYGRRLLSDGTILDDPPILIASGLEPDVSAVGSDFLVVGTEDAGDASVSTPFGVRVRGTDGLVLDMTPIQLGQSYARRPKVTGMINRWAVTWERHPAFDDDDASVWAAFVDTDGTTPGEFGVATNQSTSRFHYAPAIASSPAFAMIVWQDKRTDDWNLYGRRVLLDGTLFDDPDGFEIVTDIKDQMNAAIGWNGSTFQVVYEVTEPVGYFNDSAPDVYGTRVTEFGEVVPPANFPIEDGERPEVLPAVDGGGGLALAAISVFESGVPYASYRIETHVLLDGTTGIAETADESEAGPMLQLLGTHPNPAAASARIAFSLREQATVSLGIYDVRGRLVRQLIDAPMQAGDHGVPWDGRDAAGEVVAAGVYLYRVNAGDIHATGKLAILR